MRRVAALTAVVAGIVAMGALTPAGGAYAYSTRQNCPDNAVCFFSGADGQGDRLAELSPTGGDVRLRPSFPGSAVNNTNFDATLWSDPVPIGDHQEVPQGETVDLSGGTVQFVTWR